MYLSNNLACSKILLFMKNSMHNVTLNVNLNSFGCGLMESLQETTPKTVVENCC